jgi:hypothetical protein
LNSLLASAQQAYEELRGLFGSRSLSELKALTEDQRKRAMVLSYNLLRTIERANSLLTEYALDARPHSTPSAALEIFKREIGPREDELRSLFIDLLDLPDLEIDLTAIRAGVSTPIWNIFQTGIDWHARDQDPENPEDDLRAAESIISAAFFNPDDWYRNAQELQPIFGEDAERRVPINVRGRLSELYQSFILANYMAAIALARSIAEYSLVDRASRIGIDPYRTDREGRRRTKRLSVLVDLASAKLPKLASQMEEIVEYGNQILHPERRDKLLLAPSALRAWALRCVNSTRELVLALYLE